MYGTFNDGFIDLNVTGGYNCENYTFNWDGPNGFNSSDQNINGLYAGIYSVTITDSNGCTFNISSMGITEPAELNATETISSYECGHGVGARCYRRLN